MNYLLACIVVLLITIPLIVNILHLRSCLRRIELIYFMLLELGKIRK
jgi:hypothetical protein